MINDKETQNEIYPNSKHHKECYGVEEKDCSCLKEKPTEEEQKEIDENLNGIRKFLDELGF